MLPALAVSLRCPEEIYGQVQKKPALGAGKSVHRQTALLHLQDLAIFAAHIALAEERTAAEDSNVAGASLLA